MNASRKGYRVIRCPRIDGDLACIGCTCVIPCAEALEGVEPPREVEPDAIDQTQPRRRDS